MVYRVRTAWISRGFVGLTLFLVGAALYLPPLVLTGWPWAANSVPGYLGWGMAACGMVVLIVYMGFVYEASKGIPFWNSPLHPVLYMAYALRGGIAALLVTMALFDAPSAGATRLITIWTAITAVVIVLFILEIQGALTGGNPAARQSARDMLAGRMAVYFYVGTLLIGLVVPLALLSGHIAPLSVGVLAAIGLFSALGDFFMKYTTIRAGHLSAAWAAASTAPVNDPIFNAAGSPQRSVRRFKISIRYFSGQVPTRALRSCIARAPPLSARAWRLCHFRRVHASRENLININQRIVSGEESSQ